MRAKTATLVLAIAVVIFAGALHCSCENAVKTARKIKRRQIHPTVGAAGPNRLKVVGTANVSGNFGGLILERAVVCLILDTETDRTYLVGLGRAGLVTFADSGQAVLQVKEK